MLRCNDLLAPYLARVSPEVAAELFGTLVALRRSTSAVAAECRSRAAEVGSPRSPLCANSQIMLVRIADVLLSIGIVAPLLSLTAVVAGRAVWHIARGTAARRIRADQCVHDRVRQLQLAMQANVEGVFLLRAIRDGSGAITDFEIRDVNPSGARLLRADPHGLIGRRLKRDFPTDLHAVLFARYVETIASNTPFMEEVRVSRQQFAARWLYHQSVATGNGVAVTLRDISTRKREEMRLRHASLTDDLTRLYNRRGFLTLAEQQLRIARRQGKDAVLMYVDMDDFKRLNDQHGHAEGDRALAAVGRLLRKSVRDCDVVARMGGDEFTLVALDADRVAARIIQQRIEAQVALLNASGELVAPLSLTIGHTRVRPGDQASLTELLGRADTLLYERKRRRKLAATVGTTSRTAARTGKHRPVVVAATVGIRDFTNLKTARILHPQAPLR